MKTVNTATNRSAPLVRQPATGSRGAAGNIVIRPSWLPSPETIARFSRVVPKEERRSGWEFEGKISVMEFYKREAQRQPKLTINALRTRVCRGYYAGLKRETKATGVGRTMFVWIEKP